MTTLLSFCLVTSSILLHLTILFCFLFEIRFGKRLSKPITIKGTKTSKNASSLSESPSRQTSADSSEGIMLSAEVSNLWWDGPLFRLAWRCRKHGIMCLLEKQFQSALSTICESMEIHVSGSWVGPMAFASTTFMLYWAHLPPKLFVTLSVAQSNQEKISL